MTSLRKYKQLPLHIVEDHNEVLYHILRAVGSKHLPFSNNIIIHFDSHPDLLIPSHLKASEVYNVSEMLDKLSIENWLLVACYTGQISTIIWVKPPWSNQIENGTYNFLIGKQKGTENIRVSSPLLYFVGEMLYCKHSELEDTREIKLIVVTMNKEAPSIQGCSKKIALCTGVCKGESFQDGQIDTYDSNSLGNQGKNGQSSGNIGHLSKRVQTKAPVEPIEVLSIPTQKPAKIPEIVGTTKTPETFCDLSLTKEIMELIQEHDNNYILDIDLDFFTTMNPFINMYEKVNMYSRLSKFYGFEYTTDHDTDEDLSKIVHNRHIQITNLKEIFTQIDKLKDSEKIIKEVDNICKKVGEYMEDKDRESLVSLIKDLVRAYGNEDGNGDGKIDRIDWLLIHDAGCTWDDSTHQLPHHISTNSEINNLMQLFSNLVSSLPTPTIITMARSSLDDYCPPSQVDMVQESVCEFLRKSYNVDCKRHYDEKE